MMSMGQHFANQNQNGMMMIPIGLGLGQSPTPAGLNQFQMMQMAQMQHQQQQMTAQNQMMRMMGGGMGGGGGGGGGQMGITGSNGMMHTPTFQQPQELVHGARNMGMSTGMGVNQLQPFPSQTLMTSRGPTSGMGSVPANTQSVMPGSSVSMTQTSRIFPNMQQIYQQTGAQNAGFAGAFQLHPRMMAGAQGAGMNGGSLHQQSYHGFQPQEFHQDGGGGADSGASDGGEVGGYGVTEDEED